MIRRALTLGIWLGALATSMALHALLLDAVIRQRVIQVPAAPASDIAFFDIRARPAPPPAWPPAAPARPHIPNRPRARAPIRALAPHAATPLPVPTPTARIPTVPADLPTMAAMASSASTSSARPTLVASDGPVPAPRASPPSDAAAVAQIQAVLAARAARCYPEPAARLRLAGTSEVRFCVKDGAAHAVSLVRGSGQALLDHAALECVVGGATLPALSRCLEVPVRFERR